MTQLITEVKSKLLAGSVQLAMLFVTLMPQRSQAAACADKTIAGGVECSAGTGSGSDLITNIRVITNTLIMVVGIASVVMLIIGGFRYVLSQGNEKAVTGAKDNIVYAIIGLIVALIAFAVVNFVLGQFSATPKR